MLVLVTKNGQTRLANVKPERVSEWFVRQVEAGATLRAVRGKAPSLKTMERWSFDGIARATDGCRVEPDGTCEHGHISWMMALGIV